MPSNDQDSCLHLEILPALINVNFVIRFHFQLVGGAIVCFTENVLFSSCSLQMYLRGLLLLFYYRKSSDEISSTCLMKYYIFHYFKLLNEMK